MGINDYSKKKEVEKYLMDTFGYVPNEEEKCCVYRDNALIVIHHYNIQKVFSKGCGGLYYEIEPFLD